MAKVNDPRRLKEDEFIPGAGTGWRKSTDLREVLFPVEMQPVHRYARGEGGAQKLEELERFVAVVDVERDQVFTVVTKDYVLVTNAEAIEHARVTFRRIFVGMDEDKEMEVLDLQMPKTRSSCRVDFMHRGHLLPAWDSEVFVPYLRVTNSYNSTHSLHFYLGFARAKDGARAVFETVAAEYKKAHTKKDLGGGIKFEVDPALLRGLEARFLAALRDLRSYSIRHAHGPALVLKALGPSALRAVSTKRKGSSGESAPNERFLRQIYREFNDAVDEVGGNAYAAYVVACRFADPEHAPLVGLVNSAALERAVGKWAEEFPHQRVSRGFDFDAYLADERAALEQ